MKTLMKMNKMKIGTLLVATSALAVMTSAIGTGSKFEQIHKDEQ